MEARALVVAFLAVQLLGASAKVRPGSADAGRPSNDSVQQMIKDVETVSEEISALKQQYDDESKKGTKPAPPVDAGPRRPTADGGR